MLALRLDGDGMKVKDIITHLTERYGADDELVIAWWDKQLFSFYDEDTDTEHPLSDSAWAETVQAVDGDDYGWEGVSESVRDMIQGWIQRPEREVTA